MKIDWNGIVKALPIFGAIALVTTLALGLTWVLEQIVSFLSPETRVSPAFFILTWIVFAYLAISFKKVGSKEMGLVLRFGEIIRKEDPGRIWVFYGIDKLVRAPSTQYNLNFDPKEIMSKKGKYPDGEDGETYNAVTGTVNTSLYLSLPTDEGELKKCYNTLGSFEPNDMAKHFDDAIFGAVRGAMGSQTWKESSEQREKIAKNVRDLLTVGEYAGPKDTEGNREMDEDQKIKSSNPFEKAGIKDWYLTITDLKWPKEIESALSRVEESRMNAEAAVFDAKANEQQMLTLKTTIKKLVEDNIPMDIAAKMVFDRHGDLIVANKGELKKIIIEGGGDDSLVAMFAKIMATSNAMSGSSGGNQGGNIQTREGGDLVY